MVAVTCLGGCASLQSSKTEAKIVGNTKTIRAEVASNTDNAAAATKVIGELLNADPTPSQFSETARLTVSYAQLNLGEPTAKTWLEWEPVRLSLFSAAEAKAEEFKAKLEEASKNLNVKIVALATSQEKIAKLEDKNEELTAKLITQQKKEIDKQKKEIEQAEEDAKKDDLLRKGLLAVGSLLLLAGVVIGYLRKDITVIKWFGSGAGLAFAAAWLFGQWWFPWFMVGVLCLGVFLLVKKSGLAGDLVGGVEDVRNNIKKSIESAKMGHPEYIRALKDIKSATDNSLKEWITEADGTAAQVDAIRREKGLL